MDISIQLVFLKKTIDLNKKNQNINLPVHAEETNIGWKCACTEYVKYQHQNSKI